MGKNKMNGKLVKLDTAAGEGLSENEPKSESNPKIRKKMLKKGKKTDEKQDKENIQKKEPENGGTANNIDKRVFAILKNFQNDTNSITSQMLQDLVALLKEESSQKRNATAVYVVKRLIRATGADNQTTVAMVGSLIELIVKNVPEVNELDLLELMERELPVNGQPKKKEEALAAVGQMITASILIKLSNEFTTKRELAPIYTKLAGYLEGREYLRCMSNTVIVESFATIPEKRFAKYVWPELKQKIGKPVSELNLHTFDVLLAVYDSYDNVLTHDQLMAILWPEKVVYSELFKLYLGAPKMYDARIYARFGKFLGTADTNAEMIESWQKYAYKHRAQSVASKGCIFKVLEHQIISYKNANEQPLISLFDSPLMDLVFEELLAAKTISGKKEKPLAIQLRQMCQEFECAIVLLFENPAIGDQTKASILSNLLQKRGNLNEFATMRRFTETLLNTLKYEGLQAIFDVCANLLTTPVDGEARQDNDSRNQIDLVNQMQAILQHTELEANKKKQFSMLKQILSAGICHVSAGMQPCLPAESIVSDSTADRCKTISIGFLVRSCHGDIQKLCHDLQKIDKFLKKFMSKTENIDALRQAINIDEPLAWDVQTNLESSDLESNSIAQIIEVLILFVRLAQYTSCCQLPNSILNDLVLCRNQIIEGEKGQVSEMEELSWQEVIIDILLQLLLETAAYWREFTNIFLQSVLPYLGQPHLVQLLQRLDMDTNPLCVEDADSSSEENDEKEEEESNTDDSSSDDDDNSDAEEKDEAMLDENGLDKLRDSVRQALQNGNDVDDGEASSVDWNDVDEESGKRLDESLSAIFKMRHQTTQRKKRPTKSDRIHSTTLLHFRVRVLDLVEVFANKKPTMGIILDALQCVFQVFCRTFNDKDQRPLHHASQKLLTKLIGVNIKFEEDDDRNQIIAAMAELDDATSSALEGKQIRGAPNSHELQHQLVMWRDKSYAALIVQCSDKDSIDNNVALPLLKAKLEEWLPGRKSKQPLFGFAAIFQYKPTWPGVNKLIALLVSHLTSSTHPMKRLAILKLLITHKKHRKPTADGQKALVKGLQKYVTNVFEQPLTPVLLLELKLLKQYVDTKCSETKEVLLKIQNLLGDAVAPKRKSTAGDDAPVAPKKSKKKRKV